MIDKEKKQKLDELYLRDIYDKNQKNSYIRGIANKVPDLIVNENLGYDEVYDSIAVDFYINMIKKAEKEPMEELEKTYMKSIYKYTEKSMKTTTYPQCRYYSKDGKRVYDTSINHSLYEVILDDGEGKDMFLYQLIPYTPAPKTTETFITDYFRNNYKEIFKKSPLRLDYIEKPYPRYYESLRCNGKYRNPLNPLQGIREKIYGVMNRKFGINIEKQRKKYSPEKNQEIIKKNNYYYKIAEKKAVITIIDQTITAEHIGQEFNKHKDNRYLFDMFYDNMTAASRRSINKEEYSNESITELKAALTILRNKLIKEIESDGTR